MVSLVQQNIPNLQVLCKRYAVERLYVFGSAARDEDFTDKSDIDFLADFQKNLSICRENMADLRTYFENKDELQDALSSLLNRDVDLLTNDNIRNNYLMHFINSEKILLYAAA